MFERLTQRIRAFFSPFSPDDVDPSRSDRFIFRPELDVIENDPEIGTEALKKKGETSGRMDMPPSNHEGTDLVELDVVKGYERLFLAEKAGYLDGLAELERVLQSSDPRLFPSDGNSAEPPTTESDNEQSMVVQNACADMDNAIAESTGKILKSREKACQAKVEYSAFKKRNGLTEDIEIPSRKRKALWWVVLFIVFLIESLINGLFFAEQFGGRIIHWVSQAALISTVNVGLFGFLIMICWKYSSHIQQSLKTWARVGLVILCLCALTFNLGAAHFRDAVPKDFPNSEDSCYRGMQDPDDPDRIEENPGQEAKCLLVDRFVHLAEFEAYCFFLLGLGFILLAVIDWKHILPGYPGHENAKRRFLKAQEPLNGDLESVRKKIGTIYYIARAKLESSIVEDHKFASKLVRSINDKYKDMIAYTEEVAQRCRRAIDFYRTANRLAREDISNIPSHWSRKWEHDWDSPTSPEDLGLCNSEYAQSLHDKERHYVEANLDPHYQGALEEAEKLAACPP